MTGFLISLAILLGVILFFLLVYVFYLVRPNAEEPSNPDLLCDYAHRGLHGNGIPENSLAAFEKACAEGYGIELDVQLSSDGEVMVFHDYTLDRMTGVKKKLCELTAAELSEICLADTEEKIPTFREVLSLVNGRVPLLIELKGEDLDVSLCARVALLLHEYDGPYCIESFNPLLLRAMRKLLPDVFYGLLYNNLCKEKMKKSWLNPWISIMMFNFLAKPNFIAYNEIYRNDLCVRLTTKFYHAPRFVWTVDTEEGRELARSLSEHSIFERK